MTFDLEFVVALAMIATGVFLLYRVIRARSASTKPEVIRFDRAKPTSAAPPPGDEATPRENVNSDDTH